MRLAIQKITSASVADVLSKCGIPMETANAIYSQIIDGRKQQALEMLLLEIRHGNFKNIDKSEFISTIARYQRDAVEGIAKNNLLLLAKVIKGMAVKSQLTASSFYKYADALAALTEKEIILLGVMAKRQHHSLSFDKYGDIRDEDLKKEYKIQEFEITLQALLRTGLVYFYQEVETYERADCRTEPPKLTTDFYTTYTFSPLMLEILNYVDLVNFNKVAAQ